MKKIFIAIMALMLSLTSFEVEINNPADSTINLNEVNNIFNRTNYFNATMGANELIWFRNGGTNFFVDVKYYF